MARSRSPERAAYWSLLGAGSATTFAASVVVAVAYVLLMGAPSVVDVVLRAIFGAVALTAITGGLVLASTISLRESALEHSVGLPLLAFTGPAVGWTAIGLMIGGFLAPAYATFGGVSGVVVAIVMAVRSRALRRRASRR